MLLRKASSSRPWIAWDRHYERPWESGRAICAPGVSLSVTCERRHSKLGYRNLIRQILPAVGLRSHLLLLSLRCQRLTTKDAVGAGLSVFPVAIRAAHRYPSQLGLEPQLQTVIARDFNVGP